MPDNPGIVRYYFNTILIDIFSHYTKFVNYQFVHIFKLFSDIFPKITARRIILHLIECKWRRHPDKLQIIRVVCRIVQIISDLNPAFVQEEVRHIHTVLANFTISFTS